MRTANEIATEVLPQALAGDSAAVRTFIGAVTPIVQARVARGLLRRSARAKGRNVRQEVEDVTQEVFVALFENRARALAAWRPDGGLSLVNFVGLVAEREVASILRSGRRSPWSEDPTMSESLDRMSGTQEGPERAIESKQMLSRLLDALRARLSPKGLSLFKLLFVEERGVDEVIAETGMSSDAIYAWRSRLGKAVRAAADELDEGEDVDGKRSAP